MPQQRTAAQRRACACVSCSHPHAALWRRAVARLPWPQPLCPLPTYWSLGVSADDRRRFNFVIHESSSRCAAMPHSSRRPCAQPQPGLVRPACHRGPACSVQRRVALPLAVSLAQPATASQSVGVQPGPYVEPLKRQARCIPPLTVFSNQGPPALSVACSNPSAICSTKWHGSTGGKALKRRQIWVTTRGRVSLI